MLRPFVAALAALFLFAWPGPVLAEPAPAADSQRPAVPAPSKSRPWVAVHRATGLWSRADGDAKLFRVADVGERLQTARSQEGSRLYVWDPGAKNYAYVDAADVGPAPRKAPRSAPQPSGAVRPENLLWHGTARVTMYTCVEMGGCNPTASGVWPYEGVVAVDPRIIPLGSTVWIDGLGIFLAADTGSLVKGERIDVYVYDYSRARAWGIQYLTAAAYR